MTTAHQIAFIRSRQIKVTGWTAVRPADPHLAPVLPAASLQCGGAIKICSHDDGDLLDCRLHHLAAAHYDHTFFWQPAKDTHLADACV